MHVVSFKNFPVTQAEQALELEHSLQYGAKLEQSKEIKT